MSLMTSSSGFDTQATPLVDTGSLLAGTAAGVGVAVTAGSLWSAAAFSSGDSTFYNHLAWWFGVTLIGASLVGGLVAATLSPNRGAIPGLAGGLSASGLVVAVCAAMMLAVAGTSGASAPLDINGGRVAVELMRPYVAFWSVLLGFGAAAVAGVAGGLIHRSNLESRYAIASDSRPAPQPRLGSPSPAA